MSNLISNERHTTYEAPRIKAVIHGLEYLDLEK